MSRDRDAIVEVRSDDQSKGKSCPGSVRSLGGKGQCMSGSSSLNGSWIRPGTS